MFTNKPTNDLQLSLKHFNIEQNKHTLKKKKVTSLQILPANILNGGAYVRVS